MALVELFDTLGSQFLHILTQVREYMTFYESLGVNGIFRDFQPPPTTTSPHLSLESICEHLQGCQRCKLHSGRTHIVFGAGNPQADLIFIGEGPGYYEDLQGEPFVGSAGALLTRILAAIELRRDEVYITNIVKCRPPNNRKPEPDEIAACEPFLHQQLQVIQPKIICALGACAAQTLLQTTTPISQLRGRFHDYHGIRVMPTYHPAYLLRNPQDKRLVWHDIQLVQQVYQEVLR
jgi:uracil-DNA glycosylase family 4